MATPTILDFYRYSVPRGLNIKQKAEWTTTSSASVVITAATGRIYFIQGIEFYISSETDIGANSITITHSSDTFGGVKSTIITIPSIEDLVTMWGPATETTVSCNYFGAIIFEVPVRLDAAETLTVAHSAGAGGITSGKIGIGFTGWHIATADL